MEVKFDYGKSVKRVFELIAGFQCDVSLHCNERGIEISCINVSKTCFVKAFLRGDEYTCKRDLCLPLNLDDVSRVLRDVQNESLKMVYKDGANAIRFILKDGHCTRKVDVRLIQLEEENYNLELDRQDKIEMSSKQFKRLCSNFLQIGKLMEIGVSDCLFFRVKEKELNGTIKFVNLKCSKKWSDCYSTEVLVNCAKSSVLADDVILYPGDPLKLSYEMEYGHVHYFIAPRKDEDLHETPTQKKFGV